MRNIATCYSEHAVKVSDSYCSGPLNRSYISPKSSSTTPSIQNVVSCTYKTQISSTQKKSLFITITWCSKLICQGFFIKISEKNHHQREKTNNNNNFQHGFHQLSKIKGTKVLQQELGGSSSSDDQKFSVSIHWDVSQAKFEAGPKPIRGYYIILNVMNSEYSLVIGDMGNDPIVENLVKGLKRVDKLSIVSQYEQYYYHHHNHHSDQSLINISTSHNNNQILSKAKFKESGEEHDIMINCGTEEEGVGGGSRRPAISVYIDKKRVVRIKRLQWNFRGNQVIFVDGLLVDVMWDVYGWYFDQTVGRFNNKGGNNGFIMFRTRSGLDSRLWLEEEEIKLADKFHGKPEFSLLISASIKN